MVTGDKVIKAAQSTNMSIASLLNLQSALEGDVPDHLVREQRLTKISNLFKIISNLIYINI